MLTHRRVGRAAQEDGAVALIVLVLLAFVLVGMGALAINAGAMYSHKRSLQTVADAAALAGVLELPAADAGPAKAVAEDYAETNLESWAGSDWASVARHVVDVTLPDTVYVEIIEDEQPVFLWRFINFASPDNETVFNAAHARARVLSPKKMAGLMPFGLMARETTNAAEAFGYEFGVEYALRVTQDDSEYGNFHTLTLDGQPQNVIGDGGSDEAYAIGDELKPAPGIRPVVGTRLEDYVGDGALITVPIIVNPAYPDTDPRHYNWTQLQGASSYVRIIGFAQFWAEPSGIDKFLIMGTFIQTVDVDAEEWGEYNEFGLIKYALVSAED